MKDKVSCTVGEFATFLLGEDIASELSEKHGLLFGARISCTHLVHSTTRISMRQVKEHAKRSCGLMGNQNQPGFDILIPVVFSKKDYRIEDGNVSAILIQVKNRQDFGTSDESKSCRRNSFCFGKLKEFADLDYLSILMTMTGEGNPRIENLATNLSSDEMDSIENFVNENGNQEYSNEFINYLTSIAPFKKKPKEKREVFQKRCVGYIAEQYIGKRQVSIITYRIPKAIFSAAERKMLNDILGLKMNIRDLLKNIDDGPWYCARMFKYR